MGFWQSWWWREEVSAEMEGSQTHAQKLSRYLDVAPPNPLQLLQVLEPGCMGDSWQGTCSQLVEELIHSQHSPSIQFQGQRCGVKYFSEERTPAL